MKYYEYRQERWPKKKKEKKKNQTVWNQKVPLSLTNSVLHLLLLCAHSNTFASLFSLGPVKIYSVSVAPVLSLHDWSKPVAEERFTRPFATHQRIIPKSCAIPDRGIAPSFFRIYRSNLIEEKHFQSCERSYTCDHLRKRKACDNSGTQAWNRETLNIYPSSPEKRWKKSCFVG